MANQFWNVKDKAKPANRKGFITFCFHLSKMLAGYARAFFVKTIQYFGTCTGQTKENDINSKRPIVAKKCGLMNGIDHGLGDD